MQMIEQIKKPVGEIKLIAHRGQGIFRPWTDSMEKDPRFGTLDLSNVEILKSFEDKNLIVNQASVLMAQRMAPGDLGTAGIGYLALGTGVGTGTQAAPQTEDPTLLALRQEVFRKAITSWTYLDATGKAVASPPNGTGVIQFTTTFAVNEANYAITEMGLFGGTASGSANSGSLFNFKVFPVWNKTSALNASLTIIWTITF